MAEKSGNGEKIKAAEFRGMVLAKLDAMRDDIAEIKQGRTDDRRDFKDLRDIVIEQGKCVERLNVKASIWGGFAGVLTSLVAYLIGGNRA